MGGGGSSRVPVPTPCPAPTALPGSCEDTLATFGFQTPEALSTDVADAQGSEFGLGVSGRSPSAGFLPQKCNIDECSRRATWRGPAEPILQAAALPVVAPAAVGQGPVAADSFHRRLPAPLRAPRTAAEAARGSALGRCRPGRGRRTVPFPPPGGDDPPLWLRQWRGRAGCGDPGPRGPLPRAESRGGAAAVDRTAYLFISDVCATSPWQPLHLFRRR